MVYSSIFPINGEDYENLVESIAKLKLNDASNYEKKVLPLWDMDSVAVFLGMLYLEIVKERLAWNIIFPLWLQLPACDF